MKLELSVYEACILLGVEVLEGWSGLEGVISYWCVDLVPSHAHASLTTAGLRRSFRLRKDRHGSPGEPQTPDASHTDFLIYEEVTQYLPRPGDSPRLIVLIGRTCACPSSLKAPGENISHDLRLPVVTGSLGARISELKQKVIVENPRRYGLAVPRKSTF